jgi:D-alanyl-D-alanine carboxypeptidase
MKLDSTVRKAFRAALVGAAALVAVLVSSGIGENRAWAGYADIVIDASSGEVLHARNADVQNYPASLTKMMTLYLLFDSLEKGKLKLDDGLYVSSHAEAQPATKLGLNAGDTIKVEKAILAIIIQSANDAAVVVGEAIGGTEDNFADLMTKKARALGMTNTNFENASGLPDTRQHTTARDLAVLARALMTDFPQYYHYFSVTKFVWGGRTIKTHNRLMVAYDGADGLKTGYIRASGFNLVTSAIRNNTRVIGVVLGGKSPSARDQQMAKLLDGGFAEMAMADNGRDRNTVVPGVKPADLGVAIASLDDQTDTNAMVEAANMPETAITAAETASATGEGDVDTGDTGEGSNAAVPPDGGWGVQVGAFLKYAPAKLAATNAQREYRGLVDAHILVDESKTHSGATMYRSRLIGLTQADAETACKGLRKLGTACLVVKVTAATVADNAQ